MSHGCRCPIRHGRGYGLHAEVLQYPLPPNCDCRHVTRTDKLGVVQACVSDLVCGTKQPDFVLSGTLRTPRNARQTREASHLEQCRRTWGSLRRSICNTAEGDCFRGLWAHTVATSLLLHRDLVDVLPHWGLVRTEDAWLALREWGYFDGADNQLVLQYSISRYHEFLDLAHFGHRSGLAHSFAIQEPVHEGYIQLRRPSQCILPQCS